MNLKLIRSLAAACTLLLIYAFEAQAQPYPTRPITLVVPIPPGGAPDVAARVLAEKLTKNMGQAVVVLNKVGANGNIAAEAVAKSAPDGYTLMLGQDSIFVINPFVYRTMPVDVRRELIPVSAVASNAFLLALNPSVPAQSFSEFIEYARKADPPLTYASSGNGSQHHLMMEMLKQRAGIKLLHIPYKGGSPATMATLSGEVAAMFAGTSVAPQIKAGKLRAIAYTGAKRSDAFPGLPTIGESYPGYEATIWLGVFAPTGTPEPIIGRLREEIAKALDSPDVKQRLLESGGLKALALTPTDFASLIERDAAKYEKLVRQMGISID